MPFEGRNLILKVGGDVRLREGVKGLLRHVAQKTGIGIASLQKCWKGQYASKNTISKLQQAANNADNLASRIEALANDAEMAGRPRRDTDFLREMANSLRNSALSVRDPDTREE